MRATVLRLAREWRGIAAQADAQHDEGAALVAECLRTCADQIEHEARTVGDDLDGRLAEGLVAARGPDGKVDIRKALGLALGRDRR